MLYSPPEWACELVSELHSAGFTRKALSEEAGMNPKYVGQVLRGKEKSSKAEAKLRAALNRLKERNE